MRPREVTRLFVNRHSALRDSASPASSDSQWDYPSGDWHDFSAHNQSWPAVDLWAEDSDYSADHISDWIESPTVSGSGWPLVGQSLGDTLDTQLLDLELTASEEITERRHREVLIDYFCNVLSHLLVFREDAGNPFQEFVLPISHPGSPVLDVLLAFSSSHIEHRDIQNEEKSLYFHNKALQGLGKLIDDFEEANKEEVLSTIMLLVYYEVVSTLVSFIIITHN